MSKDNCEIARKDLMFPERYRCQSKKVKIHKISMMSYDLCFEIPSKEAPYDAYLGDKLASTCPGDVEEQIDIFKNAGYTEKEIREIFDLLYYEKRHGRFPEINLPRPVEVEVNWLEYKWGS